MPGCDRSRFSTSVIGAGARGGWCECSAVAARSCGGSLLSWIATVRALLGLFSCLGRGNACLVKSSWLVVGWVGVWWVG